MFYTFFDFLVRHLIYTPFDMFYRMKKGIKRWHYRNRPPPYKTIMGADPLGNTAGNHNTHFVSRHAIAETGLQCLGCNNEATNRGDFSPVVETQYGEAVQCGCGAWNVASPDTEHGDNLLPYSRTRFHKFVRRTPAQVIKDMYGDDVQQKEGNLQANRIRMGDVAPVDNTTPDPRHAETDTHQPV